eukprot:scaffold840_cov344-Pavlova_lutheri.AAC.136
MRNSSLNEVVTFACLIRLPPSFSLQHLPRVVSTLGRFPRRSLFHHETTLWVKFRPPFYAEESLSSNLAKFPGKRPLQFVPSRDPPPFPWLMKRAVHPRCE